MYVNSETLQLFQDMRAKITDKSMYLYDELEKDPDNKDLQDKKELYDMLYALVDKLDNHEARIRMAEEPLKKAKEVYSSYNW